MPAADAQSHERTPAPGDENPAADSGLKSAFATSGGRDFAAGDGAGAPAVAIVNSAFVRRYLGDADPLQTTLRLGEPADAVRIVGVAPDLLQVVTPRARPQPEIYLPYSQRARWATMLVLRTDGPSPATALAALKDRIAAIDPEIRTGTPALMNERLQHSASGPRFVMLLFGLFAALALLLSATGIAGSLFLSRVLSSMLPDLDPVGPGLAAVAALLFTALGSLTCYIPARRAALTDPAAVMRG